MFLGQTLLSSPASGEVVKSEKSLDSVRLGTGSKIIVLKIHSASKTDAKAAVEELKIKYGISKLNVVIANAGILRSFTTVLDSSSEEFNELFTVNTLGPVLLFRATWPLLD